MKKYGSAIIIIANKKNQLILRNFLGSSIKSELVFTDKTEEAKMFSRQEGIGLIIVQINHDQDNLSGIDKLHKSLSQNGSVPIIYLLASGLQKKIPFEKLKSGSFDILTLPIDKFLLINKVKQLLWLGELRSATKKNKRNSLIHDSDEYDPMLLKKRTKQLSIEIQNHIKTQHELLHQQKWMNENKTVFSALLDSIPNPVVIKDHEGKYLQCNPAFEQFFGIKSSELKEKTVFDFFEKSFANKIQQFDRDLLSGNKVDGQEHSHLKPEGTVVNVMIYKNVFSFGNDSSPGTITTIVDITHLKRVEDLLNVQYTIDYLASLEKGIKHSLDMILDYLLKLYWVDGGGIYLYNKQKVEVNLISHQGLSERFVRGVELYKNHSDQIKMLQANINYYIKPNEINEEAWRLAEEDKILLFVIIPLIDWATGELVGSLNLASRSIEELKDEDKKGIESIAQRIVNLILYAQSQEKLKESQSFLESKVEEKTFELKNKIQELVLKEKEIRKSEEKYRTLQENIPLGIFSSSIEGKLLYANPAVARIFGYDSVEEIMKVPVKDLYFKENQREENIQISRVNGFLKDKEIRLKRKDTSVFWGLVSVNTIFNKTGQPLRFNGTIEDISEIRQAQAKLEEANKEIRLINQNLEVKINEALRKQEIQNSMLIQKSKLESLGELSAGIAHEINQPLGVMSLTFENLKLKMASKKLTPQYLESKFQSIDENIKRIRDIMDHIRTFSREQDSFVLDKVNINKVIGKALSMIGTQYRNHNITIRTELKENLGFTVGSNLKIEQVILNLLSNSKYALDEKGVYVNETEFKKEILIKTDATDKKIILRIEDNGVGIKFSNLTNIFDPFFTTKPEGFGTGLGLSIVWGIIKNMHGDIIVNSMERKYTKFRITFPRFPEND